MSDAEQADGNDTYDALEEESKGPDDIYKMARALSRDTSPSSKRLPKSPPNQHDSTLLAAARLKCLTSGNRSILF